MRPINKIIIHCSATPEGRNITVADIDAWHRAQGFRSIGYHYVIYLDGTIHPGRPLDRIGAHCRGHNRDSIGICYIGGIDARGKPKDTRTLPQKKALARLIRTLKSEFPRATIHGHNELTCQRASSTTSSGYAECNRQCTQCKFAAKACPSFNLKNDSTLCAI